MTKNLFVVWLLVILGICILTYMAGGFDGYPVGNHPLISLTIYLACLTMVMAKK